MNGTRPSARFRSCTSYEFLLAFSSYKPAPDKRKVGEDGHRFTHTRRLGDCPSRITIRRSRPAIGPEGPWYVCKVNTTHNHSVASDARLLPAKLTDSEIADVREKRAAGVSMSTFAELLQMQHDEIVTAQALNNALQKAKQKYKAGRTDTQVMLDQLEKAGIPFTAC